jgi:hypothetical protein
LLARCHYQKSKVFLLRLFFFLFASSFSPVTYQFL